MDEYLKLLLEQIRCTKARPYIKQELQDHMEDQIAENMKAGMDHEQAEKEAVRDMGDPVETGISLDSIHRPQAAWKLLGIIIFISIAGVLIHAGISGKASENAVAGSDRYVFHVMIGLAVMMILYLLDYTVLAKFSKIIAAVLLAVCLLVILEGGQVNGARIFISLPGGRRGMDVQKLMLFYVPIYGAILYKYHGWGYKGLIRAILWLIAPVILVYSQKEKNYLWNMGCVFDRAHSSFSEYVPEKQAGGISNCAHTGDVFQRQRNRLSHKNVAFTLETK